MPDTDIYTKSINKSVYSDSCYIFTNSFLSGLSPAHMTKFSLTSFLLTSFICSCVQHKLPSFSLTRSLVLRPARKTCPVVHNEKTKLIKEKLRRKLVHCTHEQRTRASYQGTCQGKPLVMCVSLSRLSRLFTSPPLGVHVILNYCLILIIATPSLKMQSRPRCWEWTVGIKRVPPRGWFHEGIREKKKGDQITKLCKSVSKWGTEIAY